VARISDITSYITGHGARNIVVAFLSRTFVFTLFRVYVSAECALSFA